MTEVWYGRQSDTVCPHEKDENLFCSTNSFKTTYLAQSLCQDEHYCAFSATTMLNALGDPCNGIDKYMAVKYQCVPSKFTWQFIVRQ